MPNSPGAVVGNVLSQAIQEGLTTDDYKPNTGLQLMARIARTIVDGENLDDCVQEIQRLLNLAEAKKSLYEAVDDVGNRIAQLQRNYEDRDLAESQLSQALRRSELKPYQLLTLLQRLDARITELRHPTKSSTDEAKVDIQVTLKRFDKKAQEAEAELEKMFEGTTPQEREIGRRSFAGLNHGFDKARKEGRYPSPEKIIELRANGSLA